MQGLDALFRPRSIAVIGASSDPSSIPGRLFANLKNSFQGSVYPVNPHRREVQDVRAYASVSEIPEAVDLAFVVTPSQAVLPAISACAEKGIPGLVVISAGFSEIGSLGAAQQKELLKTIQAAGMRALGPNCFGVLNTDPAIGLTGVFTDMTPRPGRVAVGSQSGALGIIVPELLERLGLGVSMFASIGNKADIDETDLLEYWEKDPRSDCILLYLEAIKRPREFRRMASRVSRKKPVVVLKAGRTESSQRAAGSHTAALASPAAATEALLAQSGVIRAETLEEFFGAALTLSGRKLPRGRRCAILTNAGGPGVVCVDALEQRGWRAPEFSAALQERLRAFCPPHGSVRNPVDLIASVDHQLYRRCLAEILPSDEVDAVIAMFVPRTKEAAGPVARSIQEAGVAEGKPVLAVFMQADAPLKELTDNGYAVPCFQFPEQAACALAAAAQHQDRLASAPDSYPVLSDFDQDRARRALDGVSGWLSPERISTLLDACGLRQAPSTTVHSEAEAEAAARELGGPAALKIVAPSVLHKAAAGGIALGVRGDAAVREAFQRVSATAADVEGVLVQSYLPGGEEVLVGVSRDPIYGHLIAFGSGGAKVEAKADVAFRLSPLSNRDVHEIVEATKIGRRLEGQSGLSAPAIGRLQDVLLRTSALVESFPQIMELDFNPVKVFPDRVSVVDARIRVASQTVSPPEPSIKGDPQRVERTSGADFGGQGGRRR